MLQHSQAHVLGFCDGRNPLLSIKFCSHYVWSVKLPTNLGVSNNNHFYCFYNFVDLKLVFSSTGSVGDIQLVSGLVYRATSAGMLVGMMGCQDQQRLFARVLQGFSSMAHTTCQFHHLRGHSCTENIPRDRKLPGFFRHGFGNWHSMTTAPL